jgi:hypothetical protein
VGVQETVDPGVVLELRNCPECGSTAAHEVHSPTRCDGEYCGREICFCKVDTPTE